MCIEVCTVEVFFVCLVGSLFFTDSSTRSCSYSLAQCTFVQCLVSSMVNSLLFSELPILFLDIMFVTMRWISFPFCFIKWWFNVLGMFFCYKHNLAYEATSWHEKEIRCGMISLATQVECWSSVVGKCLAQRTQT
jgi:hypothetical protein